MEVSPPAQEKEIGMDVFFTKIPGLDGRIKVVPEDFVVEEISIFPPPGDGKHVIARVEAKGWEMNALLNRMAAKLGMPVNFIGFAGTKDKRAVTRQIMSFPCSIESVSNMKLPGVEIEVLYKSHRPVFRGGLKGNRFDVTIRDVEEDEITVERICREIEKSGGFPNFFGIQRFGIIRPVTHLVGKYIVLGDMKKAVMNYVANPIKGEEQSSYKAREFLEETMDFSEALKIYPKKLLFERRMIAYLSKNEEDWTGALKKLPKNLSSMFIHAYQSYLFNKILSMRLKEGIPINRAIEGDIVITLSKGEVQSRHGIEVTKNNLDKVNHQIEKGNCFPSGIIIGHNIRFANDIMGKIERKVLKEESVMPEKFIIPGMPFLSSQGIRRIILSPVRKIRWKMEDKTLRLSFSLLKGCYATCLLREFMKGDVQNY
ncbi:MAG: tRNA pseudouridine(13) synthase TruD [Candidatus Thermoplasmatota archaeon]|nr:tRNA pseudouridine(13) synthase TruD [Candidatus Thermoplasmatota archaeon]